MDTKHFAFIGAAGYIAPRHLKAIKETGNSLAVALDSHDNVGILDSYFPETAFFTEFERFDRHVNRMQSKGLHLDYTTICSPNYLHDAHIRFALKNDMHAICEKPLVINARNLDSLVELEESTGKKIYTVLQLRLHQTIKELKRRVEFESRDSKYDVDLMYITSRGKWYDYSWKGVADKSGGVSTNIGIHFFDMLGFVFGELQQSVTHVSEPRRAAGFLEFEKARVRWFLSINRRDLPEIALREGKSTFRSITISGKELEFSEGFTDLHTETYKEIMAGNGFGIEHARPSIEIATSIRNAVPIGHKGDFHPYLSSFV